MISILVSGSLIGKPVARQARNGNWFVTAQLKAGAIDESFLVSVVAFDESVAHALQALDKGDDVSVSGSAKPSSWTARDGSTAIGLAVVAKQLMTTYGVKQKRAAQSVKTQYSLPARSPLLDQVDEDGSAPF
ncbi:MAG TPA: single-stranded DNA-binding protein [Pyrinomonadaceae bacterium]|nr:single-stranded DNA-binding protein [Pyrinomonadaceae bacterium]